MTNFTRREFLYLTGGAAAGLGSGYMLNKWLRLSGERPPSWNDLPYSPYLHRCDENPDVLSDLPRVVFSPEKGRKLCEPAIAIVGKRIITACIDTDNKPNDKGRQVYPLYLGIEEGKQVVISSVTFPQFDITRSQGGDPLIAVLPDNRVSVVSMFKPFGGMGYNLALSVLDPSSSIWQHDLLDLKINSPFTLIDKPWFQWDKNQNMGWLTFVSTEFRNDGTSYKKLYLYSADNSLAFRQVTPIGGEEKYDYGWPLVFTRNDGVHIFYYRGEIGKYPNTGQSLIWRVYDPVKKTLGDEKILIDNLPVEKERLFRFIHEKNLNGVSMPDGSIVITTALNDEVISAYLPNDRNEWSMQRIVVRDKDSDQYLFLGFVNPVVAGLKSVVVRFLMSQQQTGVIHHQLAIMEQTQTGLITKAISAGPQPCEPVFDLNHYTLERGDYMMLEPDLKNDPVKVGNVPIPSFTEDGSLVVHAFPKIE